MRGYLAALLLLSTLGFVAADYPQAPTTIQAQNNGTTVFTGAGFVRMNFASGCTPTNVSGTLTLNCAGSGGSVTGTGTANTMAKWTGTSAVGNSQVTDDGTNPTKSPLGFDVNTAGAYNYEIPNNASTGTTTNKTVCDDGTGKGIVCPHATSRTNQVLGFCVSGCGTTGNATVSILGWPSAVVDNQSTARDFAINSSSTDGELHDAGAALTSGQPNFFIFTANAGAHTAGQVRVLIADDFINTSPAPVIRAISFTIGDPAASSAITAGNTATDYLTIPFGCTIQAYNLAIDTGTITVKFWKVATGTAIPTVSNSISTSGVSISSGTAIHSTTLSDFTTTAIAANDIVAMNVSTVSGAHYVNGVLQCQ